MELREWQYINKPAGSTTNNSSSSSYKKRFEKLIKYHIDHASSELESITRKDIKDHSFRLGEHYNTGSEEFDRDILVAYDSSSDTFFIHIFVDRKEVESMQCDDYENFIKVIEPYMFLPDAGTQEYDDLLTESLNEWQLMNPTKPAKNPYTTGQAYRYNRLLDQITSDGIAKYKLNKLTNTTLDITVDTSKKKDLNIKIIYEPATDDYTFIVGNGTPGKGWDYEKDILDLLVAGGVISNTDLCESCPLADDFKLYENLWD